MKTEDLIRVLAADTLPVGKRAAPRRIALSMLAGLPVAAALMVLFYGVRPDLADAVHWPMFWIKLVFPLGVAAAAFMLLQRLARPGVRPGASWIGLAVPVLLLWGLALVVLASSPAEARSEMGWGKTWRTCSASIAFLSLPVFVAALVALRGLAPTRAGWAGACAGALAGGIGAAVYAVHCPELAAPFLAAWYVLGIAAAAGMGALVGPRLLRW